MYLKKDGRIIKFKFRHITYTFKSKMNYSFSIMDARVYV